MKISDAIRKWCGICRDSCIGEDDCDDLRALADRIDRETVELPKDVDGVPINVGDTVWGCNSGMKMTVKELRTTGTDSWIITTSRGYIQQGSGVTHTRPDSLERIADEIEKLSMNPRGISWTTLKEWANRIRKLAEKEDK